MEKEKHVNNSNGGDGGGSNYKVKLMCSYGGKIHPRAAGHQLAYVGGDTKILTVDRIIRFSNLITKLHSLCESNFPFQLKYQLPGYDLDALVSVIDEVDLENMMIEYDCLNRNSNKPARFRIFVFVSKVRSAATMPDFLFGFDKEYTVANASATPNSVANITTTTSPNPEASKNLDIVSAENIDPDPRDRAEIPKKTKQIQGIEAQGMVVMPDVYSLDNNVTPGGGYAYGEPVYGIPVPTASGYYQIGPYGEMHRMVGNREQPVYFVPIFPQPGQGQEQQVPLTNRHVAVAVAPSKQSEGCVAVAGGGGGGGEGGSMQPTVTSAAASMLNHETKVSLQA